MLDDVDTNSTVQYSSSGFAVQHARRPVADYFLQAKKLIGEYHFIKNISGDPMVDVYGLGDKKMYVLFIPDQKGRTASYNLDLGSGSSATIYSLAPGADEMSARKVSTNGGKITVNVTETPVFVQGN